MRLTWVEKFERRTARVYMINHNHKIKGQEYFFLKINPALESKFLIMMKGNEPFSLSDYGEIIESGLGIVPLSIKRKIKIDYDISYIE